MALPTAAARSPLERVGELRRQGAVGEAVVGALEGGRLAVDEVEVVAGAVDVAQAHEERELIAGVAALTRRRTPSGPGLCNRARDVAA